MIWVGLIALTTVAYSLYAASIYGGDAADDQIGYYCLKFWQALGLHSSNK